KCGSGRDAGGVAEGLVPAGQRGGAEGPPGCAVGAGVDAGLAQGDQQEAPAAPAQGQAIGGPHVGSQGPPASQTTTGENDSGKQSLSCAQQWPRPPPHASPFSFHVGTVNKW